jgi:hypothetical protein
LGEKYCFIFNLELWFFVSASQGCEHGEEARSAVIYVNSGSIGNNLEAQTARSRRFWNCGIFRAWLGRRVRFVSLRFSQPSFINGKAREEKHFRQIPAVDQLESCLRNFLDDRFTIRTHVTRFVLEIDNYEFAVWAQGFAY